MVKEKYHHYNIFTVNHYLDYIFHLFKQEFNVKIHTVVQLYVLQIYFVIPN